MKIYYVEHSHVQKSIYGLDELAILHHITDFTCATNHQIIIINNNNELNQTYGEYPLLAAKF
jgi:hypothetical protein